MTQEQLQERISKKEKEISKLEEKIQKTSKGLTEEDLAVCEPFGNCPYGSPARGQSWFEYHGTKEYQEIKKVFKAYVENNSSRIHGPIEEVMRLYRELCELRITLSKYQKQLEAQKDKDNTLSDIPEVLKTFRENLINAWDKYDLWKKEEISKDYKKFQEANDSWKVAWMEMNNKWGRGWHDFSYLSKEEIHKANVTAADALVINLVNRTIELTGKITDCSYLHLDQDNQGYSIINGIVIGEKGKARVESIGAGGYNIQRYHIRVLVKEVRA